MGPLTGVRVADFTWVWAGPTCTLQLAHLGAEVVRIETAASLCTLRGIGPWPPGHESPNTSGSFNQFNQGKRSITLNLAHPEAAELAKRLVSVSDIVAENFAAGVMSRLGLGYSDLAKVRPDLVMVSMSGYGQTGPDSGYVSYGPAQVPLAGFSQLTGYEGWHPMHVGFGYGDPTAGIHAAFAVLAALYHRDLTGEGQYIDLSQWETTMSVLGEAFMHYAMNGKQPWRQGNRSEQMSPHGIFRCLGDDRWVSIACGSDEEWRALATVVGGDRLSEDERFSMLTARKANEDQLEALIGSWTSERDAYEVEATLQAAGIAAAVPQSNAELLGDAHLEQTGFWVEKPHLLPAVGVRRHPGVPWRMSETLCEVWRAAPVMGQDNDSVFKEILGLSDKDISDLNKHGVIG